MPIISLLIYEIHDYILNFLLKYSDHTEEFITKNTTNILVDIYMVFL